MSETPTNRPVRPGSLAKALKRNMGRRKAPTHGRATLAGPEAEPTLTPAGELVEQAETPRPERKK